MRTRAFRQQLIITPPGGTPASIRGDLYRRGRNVDPGMDDEGGLVIDYVLLTPAGVTPIPLSEVHNPLTGELLWVHGVPDQVPSLLRGVVDHVESKCKTVYRISTVFDILRDSDPTDRNDKGDPVDTAAAPPGRTGVVGSIVERSQILPTEVDLRTVSSWVGWVPLGTDVGRGDRLKVVGPSEGDVPEVGAGFRVEGITHPVQLGLRELRLDLTRTT